MSCHSNIAHLRRSVIIIMTLYTPVMFSLGALPVVPSVDYGAQYGIVRYSELYNSTYHTQTIFIASSNTNSFWPYMHFSSRLLLHDYLRGVCSENTTASSMSYIYYHALSFRGNADGAWCTGAKFKCSMCGLFY